MMLNTMQINTQDLTDRERKILQLFHIASDRVQTAVVVVVHIVELAENAAPAAPVVEAFREILDRQTKHEMVAFGEAWSMLFKDAHDDRGEETSSAEVTAK